MTHPTSPAPTAPDASPEGGPRPWEGGRMLLFVGLMVAVLVAAYFFTN